jgi:hypothetical protein
MMNVVLLCIIMLNVIMLSVAMQIVIILSVLVRYLRNSCRAKDFSHG